MRKGQRPGRHSRIVKTRHGKRKVLVNPNIKVMLAQKGDGYLKNHDFVTERKFDGVRMVAVKQSGQVRLFSRTQKEYTHKFPEIVAKLKTYKGDFILDGEIVHIDKQLNDQFDKTQQRVQIEGAADIKTYSETIPVTYYVFDLLRQNGKDLRMLPFYQRKDKLQALITDYNQLVRVSKHYAGQKRGMILKQQKRLNREGVMHKRLDSTYQSGVRSPDWRKEKFMFDKEILIIGYEPGKGRLSGWGIGALYTAEYKNGKLRYTGKIGTGFTDQQRRELKDKFYYESGDSLAHHYMLNESGVTNQLSYPEQKRARWFKPVPAEIVYFERSKRNHFRHGVFKGLRLDKKPEEVST